jgi:hypothetical protein
MTTDHLLVVHIMAFHEVAVNIIIEGGLVCRTNQEWRPNNNIEDEKRKEGELVVGVTIIITPLIARPRGELSTPSSSTKMKMRKNLNEKCSSLCDRRY